MKKILYVDDETLNLKLFEVNLRKKYQIFTATNGFEGLEVMNQNPDIQIIISDVKMPCMSGIEFIEKIKEKYPEKRCFLLTSFDAKGEIKKALEEGLIEKLLQKPFNLSEIESVLAEIY